MGSFKGDTRNCLPEPDVEPGLAYYKRVGLQHLYLGVQAISWTEVFIFGATFAVDNDTIRNGQYGAMKVKGALVILHANSARPNVACAGYSRWHLNA